MVYKMDDVISYGFKYPFFIFIIFFCFRMISKPILLIRQRFAHQVSTHSYVSSIVGRSRCIRWWYFSLRNIHAKKFATSIDYERAVDTTNDFVYYMMIISSTRKTKKTKKQKRSHDRFLVHFPWTSNELQPNQLPKRWKLMAIHTARCFHVGAFGF